MAVNGTLFPWAQHERFLANFLPNSLHLSGGPPGAKTGDSQEHSLLTMEEHLLLTMDYPDIQGIPLALAVKHCNANSKRRLETVDI